MVIRLECSDGEPTLKELTTAGPLNTWKYDPVSLTPYAGHQVGIDFLAVTDGSVPTAFRIDDVKVLNCGAAASVAAGAPPSN